MAAVGANGQWIRAENGFIPPNAFPGGDHDGEPVFVARGRVGGSVAAGSLLASQRCCFVAWDGQAHRLKQYEVLCNFNGTWVEWNGSRIHQHGLPAGVSEVNEESLYVGRAEIDKLLIVGKVQPSHGVVYIPHDGREIAFERYEILVPSA